MINDSVTFFQLRNIDKNSKIPIFYFDYQDNETYPEKPEDLDFKKLKQMTNTFKKLGRYILIFGDKGDDEMKKLFTGTSAIDRSRNADDWANIKHDENGRIITNDLIKMQLFIPRNPVYNWGGDFNYLWWKPLLPLHKDFVPDNYDSTIKNFSDTTTNNNSNS